MRFSAAITLPLPFRVAMSEPAVRPSTPLPQPAELPPGLAQPAWRELPQELDQRVREIGEW